MRPLAAGAAAIMLAGCATGGGADGFRQAELEKARANIGEARWSGALVAVNFCTDLAENSCERIKSAHYVVTDAGLKDGTFIARYTVRLDDGRIAYISQVDLDLSESDDTHARKAAEKKDCDRRGGIAVGMTAKQVLASCWGRPEHVNRTTTAHGTHEQWVYHTSNYVYLDNGIVTAIQN